MSFRLKTVLGIALIEATLLLALILVSLDYLRTSTEREFLNRAQTAAQLFASTTKDAVLVTDVALLDTLVQEVLTNPGVVYARVVGRDAVLAQGGRAQALARPYQPDETLATVRDGVFDAHAELAAGGEVYGRVELGFAVDGLTAVLHEARTRAGTIALIEMGLVALFSLALGTYLTRQLGALRGASQRLAEGDLASRVPVHGSDELAETATAFNAMAARLQQASHERERAERELVALNEQLEARVRARTLELAEANRQLRHQALHDPLTHLPNRSLFHDRLHTLLATAEREERRFAVALLDLDRFKEINDTRGHGTGDQVLRETARRLTAGLREADSVARLGGDEFALILPDVVDPEGVHVMGARVLEALLAPMHVGDEALSIGASIGVALYPEHGREPEELLRHADAAMYRAKFSRTGLSLYRPGAGGGAEDGAARTALRRTVAEGAWTVHYQPCVTLREGRLCGFEALVRWPHPTHGLLPPARFLPQVERSGWSPALTDAVIRKGLRQCADWRRAGAALSVSVNLAASALQDDDLALRVAHLLSAAKASPSWLELELPARVLLDEPHAAAELIETLDALGVRVALDRVGAAAAHSPLLNGLRLRTLKLDTAWVRDALVPGGSADLLAAAVARAHGLGLEVIAVGVETAEAWEAAAAWGCDAAQGYYVGPPAPAEEALLRLKRPPGAARA